MVAQMLTFWPAGASKARRASLLAVGMLIVLLPPMVMTSVPSTSAGPYGEGGIKKVPAVTPMPSGVVTLM